MALIDVRMPHDDKEGTEASLGRWLKQTGDAVHEHEPVVEISTDKVTLELPAPATGILRARLKQSGDTLVAGDLLGTVDTSAEDEPANTGSQHKPAATNASASSASFASTLQPERNGTRPAGPAELSPVARRLLAELGLDAAAVPKTARGGRLTPQDIAAYLKDTAPSGAFPVQTSPPQTVTGRLVPHTPMRRSIASHMTRSVQAAPHVTSVFEADMSAVFADRETRKQAAAEIVPSVTAYIIGAALQAIAVAPQVNSKWHDAHVEMFDHVHFGVGTALDAGGLVVPVIRDADTMNLLQLSDALRRLTEKARSGKLTAADMEGGTFTLSNHGVSGSLLATPIVLPHGQAAILGTGKVQKRVIVCDTGGRELFRIRPMMYVTLTVDHRVLDGQQTNAFLTAFVHALEQRSS